MTTLYGKKFDYIANNTFKQEFGNEERERNEKLRVSEN